MPQGWLQFRQRELGHLRENNVLLGLPLRLPATVVFHCRGNSEDVLLWQIDFQICGGCAAEPLVDRILMVMCDQIRVSRTSAGPSGSFAVNCAARLVLGFPVRCGMPPSSTHKAAIVHAGPMLVGADTPGGLRKRWAKLSLVWGSPDSYAGDSRGQQIKFLAGPRRIPIHLPPLQLFLLVCGGFLFSPNQVGHCETGYGIVGRK
jgi:hypothetical protein